MYHETRFIQDFSYRICKWIQFRYLSITVWKVSVFGVFLVRIFQHLDWISVFRYSISLHIQSECGKIRTRKIPNTDTFHAVQSAYKTNLSEVTLEENKANCWDCWDYYILPSQQICRTCTAMWYVMLFKLFFESDTDFVNQSIQLFDSSPLKVLIYTCRIAKLGNLTTDILILN